jgi:uncharacterized protein YndB with AHSA1/START domain
MNTASSGWITARVTHEFASPPEVVFDAWLSPELVRRWMGAALDESMPGTRMVEVAIDARVGGTFTFTDTRDEDESGPTGTYLEIDRPRRLAFTWLPEDGEHSVVTIDIEPTETGCRLTLVHEMEPRWSDYLDQTQTTWERMIRQIDALGLTA